ncbi:hypothetical protein Glove_30g76 [Diversispora epigaea]|uniref:Uncharacterized protein n=1 Tax=Diversispora epigaea TaxID=1348612 RepID=A0A397JSC3_9GLOM|nr:hypothetical protein Glove_30g76 [Diversispora epigaea]
MGDATDPIRNLTNSGNPVLASLGGLAVAATSIVRGGLRGENNFTEMIELIMALFFEAGRPGHLQVRVVLTGGTEVTRRWFTINWRKQGYCGLHNINKEESTKLGGHRNGHGCVVVLIVKEEPKTTVAYTISNKDNKDNKNNKNIIPVDGYSLKIHSPCCPSYGEFQL